MNKKKNMVFIILMFVGLLLIIGGFIYKIYQDNIIEDEFFVSVPYFKVDVEEGTRIIDDFIAYKEISELEYNKISKDIYVDSKSIIGKCSSNDIKSESFFYINILKECESQNDINIDDEDDVNNEEDNVNNDEENVQEKSCNDYKKYPDDGSDNLVILEQYSDRKIISELEKIVNLFNGRVFTNNSNCDGVSVFEYINEGNKVVFNNFKDENELLFIFLNYYFENVGESNVKTIKCEGGSGECYVLPIKDVKKYSKALFDFDIVEERVESFGYKDNNNYYIGTDFSSMMIDVEKKDFMSIGIDSKTKDIHYKNKYFIVYMNKEIVVNYVFKLNDEGNYYLYSMSSVK